MVEVERKLLQDIKKATDDTNTPRDGQGFILFDSELVSEPDAFTGTCQVIQSLVLAGKLLLRADRADHCGATDNGTLYGEYFRVKLVP